MNIHKLKRELGLKNKDIAKLFSLDPKSYTSSSAKERYENALCSFYELIKTKQPHTS